MRKNGSRVESKGNLNADANVHSENFQRTRGQAGIRVRSHNNLGWRAYQQDDQGRSFYADGDSRFYVDDNSTPWRQDGRNYRNDGYYRDPSGRQFYFNNRRYYYDNQGRYYFDGPERRYDRWFYDDPRLNDPDFRARVGIGAQIGGAIGGQRGADIGAAIGGAID